MLDYKISVIVPVYNTEEYLDKCIQSIINQSYDLHEIILVNDGSTDGSLKICKKYGNIDGRIKIIDTVNEGLVAARKKGLKEATGDYIAFVDSDDWIDCDMFEKVLEACADEDIISFGLAEEYGYKTVLKKDAVASGYYEENNFRNNIIKKMLYNNIFFQFGIRPNLVTKIIKKGILDKCVQYISDNVTVGEDGDFTYHALVRANSIRIENIYPYHYIQRKESMMHNDICIDSLKTLYYDLSNIELKKDDYEQWKMQMNAYFTFVLLLKKTSSVIEKISIFNKLFLGKKIIIYGAGSYGIKVFEVLNNTGDYNIIGIADKNWKEISKTMPNVENIDDLLLKNYDYIYLAILDEKICADIKNMLIKKNVEKNKVVFLNSKSILKANIIEELLA